MYKIDRRGSKNRSLGNYLFMFCNFRVTDSRMEAIEMEALELEDKVEEEEYESEEEYEEGFHSFYSKISLKLELSSFKISSLFSLEICFGISI